MENISPMITIQAQNASGISKKGSPIVCENSKSDAGGFYSQITPSRITNTTPLTRQKIVRWSSPAQELGISSSVVM